MANAVVAADGVANASAIGDPRTCDMVVVVAFGGLPERDEGPPIPSNGRFRRTQRNFRSLRGEVAGTTSISRR